MIFKLPQNVTYTQMAQWVDARTSSSDYDRDLMCEYLYHLIHLRAKQKVLFKDPEELDDFCIYCTSRLLTRLQNNSRSKDPIKSIVNYIKNIIDLWKADYIREAYAGSPDAEILDFNVVDYGDYLIDVSSYNDHSAYCFYCSNITDVIKKYLNKIPRRRHSSEWSNIYLSCLLTLNNRLNVAMKLLENNKKHSDARNRTTLLRALKIQKPVLFHLNDSFENYIQVLVNEIVHALASELSYKSGYEVSVSDCLSSMVAAAAEDQQEEYQ